MSCLPIMTDCIFCKIVAGEIPSVKIWEDQDFFAILDIFPNCKAQTLVIPKQHFDSDVFTMDNEYYTQYLLAVKKVVSLLKMWLWLQRIAIVMEWMGVNHAHFKLYPMHGVGSERKEYLWWKEVLFEQYPWYITTEVGPKADMDELQKIAQEIKTK